MLVTFLISLIVNAIALYVVTLFVPGVGVDNNITLVISALVVGIVNGLIKPVVKLISLPLTIITFGLFALVVNAFMFGLAAWIVPGFSISGIFPAFIGAIVLTIVSTLLNFFAKGVKQSAGAVG